MHADNSDYGIADRKPLFVEAQFAYSWTAFVSAMTDLRFSVQPRTGSVYAFFPPESMHVSKPLTLHRPHKSEIESYHAIVYAKRLRRV